MHQLQGSALLVALSACLTASCATSATDAPGPRPAVVVELFTSEGCSSCPPADAVLADLAKADAVEGIQIIPLGLHVDYWNHLGWADPYSSSQFSDRQQQYARLFRSDEIYTPQMIVNGTEQFNGGDKLKATRAIAAATSDSRGTISIQVLPDSSHANAVACKFSIDGIQPAAGATTNVMLAITEDDLMTEVRRGENAGQTLRHTAVVRLLNQVATLGPKDMVPFSGATTIELAPTWKPEHLHVVIFAQDPHSGKILTAGEQRVPDRQSKK